MWQFESASHAASCWTSPWLTSTAALPTLTSRAFGFDRLICWTCVVGAMPASHAACTAAACVRPGPWSSHEAIDVDAPLIADVLRTCAFARYCDRTFAGMTFSQSSAAVCRELFAHGSWPPLAVVPLFDA